MSQKTITLAPTNSQRVDAIAQTARKTPDEVVNEAVERFAANAESDEHEKFVKWREATERLPGIWKDRSDLPDFDELRKSWDRGYGLRE